MSGKSYDSSHSSESIEVLRLSRSSHRRSSVKYLCWSLSLIRPEACNFVKQRLKHRYFPVKFKKFLRTSFSQNISGGCFCLSPHQPERSLAEVENLIKGLEFKQKKLFFQINTTWKYKLVHLLQNLPTNNDGNEEPALQRRK